MRRDDEPILFRAEAECVGVRLDLKVSELAEVTRSAAARLIEDGSVRVNEGASTKNYRIRLGDLVEITLPAPEPCEALPQEIPLEIVYEDDSLIVVNKPCGMVVHPAPGNPDGTLVNALLWHCKGSLSGVGGVARPGIVHRIDKDTSGLLVVAKNDEAHLKLTEQLKGHRIDRIYYAVAVGSFREEAGTVDAPIGRHPVDRKRMAVIRNAQMKSRSAVTHYRVLAETSVDGEVFSLIRCQLETGRTHQIRVHMASIGHPLLGDPVYGGDRTRFEGRHRGTIQGQCLHAGELHFKHPLTGELQAFCCPMPAEMKKTVALLFGRDVAEELIQ